jgi:hypothetical protein
LGGRTESGYIVVVSESEDWEVIEYSGGEHERSGLPFSQWILKYLNGGGSSGYFVTSKARIGFPFYKPAASPGLSPS